MQPSEGYGTLPMDLHMPPQGYHPYYSVLEMRKEKSRDAARSRRGKENYEFYELAKLLPLPAAITSQLDKASIIRLSISYLKLRDFSSHGDPPWGRDTTLKSIKSGHIRSRSMGMTVSMELFEQHQGTHILQSLDGFAFALNADGRFLYVSETVSIYLGLSQVEMTGSSVFDYIHHQDHAELAEQLGINLSQASTSPGSTGSDDGSSNAGGPSTPTDLDRPAPVMTVSGNSLYKGLDRSFCIRMKSTLTKRGCHFKSSGYRVVLLLSHHRPQYSFSHNRKNPPVILGMVALAIALPPPSMNEVRLENDMFVTRLTFDFRIAHCEPRISELLDYTAEEMTGKNMYLLCHGQDVQKLRQCHIDLIHKGQVMSSYYRFMNKNGGYTWMQTCATIICNTKTSEEQSIICVNYVLSATEYENYIMDCSQMRHTNNLKPDDPSNSEKDDSVDKEGRDTATPDDTEPTASSPKSSHGDNSVGSDSLESNHLTQLGSSNKLPSQLLGSATQKVSLSENSSLSFLEDKQIRNESMSYEDKLSSNEISPEDNYQKDRSRKRRLQELSASADTDSKSAKAKPSSLETAAVDNGVYLVDGSSNLSESSDRLGASSKEESSSPISLTGNQTNENNKEVSRPWRCSPSHVYSEIGNSSAVPMKDLEDAINRHLPNTSTSHNNSSQDMLQKGFYAHTQHSQQSQRSAIQWIGAPQPTLPASTFLRQLYVNRESVIRSGAHPSRPSYYGDVQGTLPTPPASSSESYAPKMGAESYGVIPGYSASSGGSFMDTCSAMTPPASVSPRDKFHSTMADASAFSEASIPHLRHYVTDPPIQHLPLKPQVFVHPGTIDPAAYSHSHSQQPLSPEQQQLYAHHGFHLYHGKTAHHPVNGTSWYPQPNS